MPRNLDSAFYDALGRADCPHARFLQLTLRSETLYLWTGTGDFVFNGQTYTGRGDVGAIGDITEAVMVSADATSVTLSGVNESTLADALSDIRLGAPAKIWLAMLDADFSLGPVVIGTPNLMFLGFIGEPSISVGGEAISISLSLETGMVQLQRASNRRYTAADQALQYPTDTAFVHVEEMNDIALRWGS